MSCPFAPAKTGPSRRSLLAGAGGLLASAGVGSSVRAVSQEVSAGVPARPTFFGEHQGGIATAQQANSYFVAFDLVAKTRDEVTAMLLPLDRGRRADDGGRNGPPTGGGPVDGGTGRRIRTGPVAGPADPHVRLRRRPVHEGRRRPLRPGRQEAGAAGRPAQIQRRSVAARAHRWRPLRAGLRRRPARRVSCAARTRPFVLRRGKNPMGADGLFTEHASWRDAPQPHGLQGRDHQSSDQRRSDDARCPSIF